MLSDKKQVSILLMRHSQSEYNILQSNWKAENGLPPTHPEHEPYRFLKDPKLIDADITEFGVQ
jgi:hypothetical protein